MLDSTNKIEQEETHKAIILSFNNNRTNLVKKKNFNKLMNNMFDITKCLLHTTTIIIPYYSD